MGETKELTLKEEKFCRKFVECGNMAESYRSAGYKYSNNTEASRGGKDVFMKPHIKKYIAQLLNEYRTEAIADAQEVLEYLTNVMRGNLSEEQVVVLSDADGQSNAEKVLVQANINQRNKASELLGKRYGLFTDKVDLSSENIVLIDEDFEVSDE